MLLATVVATVKPYTLHEERSIAAGLLLPQPLARDIPALPSQALTRASASPKDFTRQRP